ncbi:MAG: hypothetical protein PHN75_16075 [Syntrophales bacterium]|nr:hypothetical protein [Syntrophales bacterium]
MSADRAEDLRQLLERTFEATFVGELIPGILHNFANPLNGIMGRAQILQRRLNDVLAKIDHQYPEMAAAFREPNKKLVSDVAAICQESDRFFNMFQDVSAKFYAIGSIAPERIDLSRLIAAELRFADYYLDFKHEIKKEFALEESSPEIYGIYTSYSLCFWSLFRNAMERMKGSSEKSLYVSVNHDEAHIVVMLRHNGMPLTEAERKEMEQVISSDDMGLSARIPPVPPACLSLRLLSQMGAEIGFRDEGGVHEMAIRIPYR